MERESDTVRTRRLAQVRTRAFNAPRSARGPTAVGVHGNRVRTAHVRRTKVREPVVGRTSRRRTVPRALVLGTDGRDRAVSGHGERGLLAQVEGRRKFQKSEAQLLAGTRTGLHVQQELCGRIRDHVRSSDFVAGKKRRSHGAVRPTGVGT